MVTDGKFSRWIKPGWVALLVLFPIAYYGVRSHRTAIVERDDRITNSGFTDGHPLEVNHPLARSLERGEPVEVVLGGQPFSTFLFKERQLVSDDFRIGIGDDLSDTLEAEIQSFEGRSAGTATAELVIVNDAIALTIRENNGATTYIRTDPESGMLQARREEVGDARFTCSIEGKSALTARATAEITDEELWQNSMPADIRAVTGVDPATGEIDKYISPIPRAPLYDQSLADIKLTLVLDKSATGSADESNLAFQASRYLATVSNVAAAYENQLGIRLLLQELIMIPDEDRFEDVPVGDSVIVAFQEWLEIHRPRNKYMWSVSIKYGAGLPSGNIGLARVSSIETPGAVGVCARSARWNILAHEMGHCLGSGHSDGGIMNSESLGRNVRTFFADVAPGVTSAMEIYEHSRGRIQGHGVLRHPEQIPFAHSDRITTQVGVPVQFDPLENDSDSVRHGSQNLLELAEIGDVTPIGAGTAVEVGNEILFTPADGFEGTAWFSYSVRGNVGNNRKGWLHKGDVAVIVGNGADEFEIVVAPGGSYSLEVGSAIGLTHPTQSQLVRSRDFSRLLIIRASDTATGTDTFEAGGNTYTIRYDASSPITTPDFIVHDPAQPNVTFNPLLNDHGAGERWLRPIRPTVGLQEVSDIFPTAFRLVSIENLSPNLGELILSKVTLTEDGHPVDVLDELVTFAPHTGAAGVAELSCTVEDAAGNRARESVNILLPFQVDRLIGEGVTARVMVPQNDSLEQSWMQPEFDDSLWRTGQTSIGYDLTGNQTDYGTYVSEMAGENASIYIRVPFDVTDPSLYTALTLRAQFDDGFVAYLNGVEVTRVHASGPSPLRWNASATTDNQPSLAEARMAIDISGHKDLLISGNNILALHGLNSSPLSSDFSIAPELDATIEGRTLGITSPIDKTIAIPANTTLLTEANSEGRPVLWSVISSPDGGNAQFSHPEQTTTSVDFTLPGLYEIGVESPGEIGMRTLSVHVGEDLESYPTGVSFGTGEFLAVEAVLVELNAAPDRADYDHIHWEVVSGPGEVQILSENSPRTFALFSNAGDYALQMTAIRQGVATVGNLKVSVLPESAHAALPGEISVVTQDTAELRGVVAGIGEGRNVGLTVYLGFADGGTSPGRWQYSRNLGEVSQGEFSTDLTDLMPDTQYAYRLVITDGDRTVWSPTAGFRTKPLADEVEVVSLTKEFGIANIVYARPFLIRDSKSWTKLETNTNRWTFVSSLPVGYGEFPDEIEIPRRSVVDSMENEYSSLYVRVPFAVTAANQYTRLLLKMQFNDGFVAYLNGVEIARAHAGNEVEPPADSLATLDIPSSMGIAEATFEVDGFKNILQEGANLLAIQGLNSSIGSPDFYIDAEIQGFIPAGHPKITSPSVASIGLEKNVGLVLEGTLPDSEQFTSSQWRVAISPPAGEAIIADPDSLSTSVEFTKEGRYVLVLSGRRPNGTQALDYLHVQVGCIELIFLGNQLRTVCYPVSFFGNGSHFNSDVRAIGAQVSLTEDLTARNLTAGVDPNLGRTFRGSVSYEKITGPGEVEFYDKTRTEATARFSDSGEYVLRVFVENDGVSTFADTTVNVPHPRPNDPSDWDGDGISNFHEWAFGTNLLNTGSGKENAPQVTMEGDEIVFSYSVRSDAPSHGLVYWIEGAADLKQWRVVEPDVVSVTGSRIKARFPSAGDVQHYRLAFEFD